jgi:2-polyprenyl-6-methoxyphenol hydroxylase-like FAD-dependent oxidoreductase
VRVVVCGGGVGGVTVGVLLHERGHEVTVLERDGGTRPAGAEDAWATWERPGVAQFRQFHGFAPSAHRTLARQLPDVLAGMLDAGLTEVDVGTRLRTLFPDSPAEDGDGELVILRGRRATFEWALRRAAESADVPLRSGASVDGLVRDDTSVGGVVVDGVELRADLVVDATGRRASSDEWLRAVGLPRSRTVRTSAGIAYYSRWYKAAPGADLPPVALTVDLVSARAVLAPADRGFASLAISVATDDAALKAFRRPAAFQAVAEALPDIGPFVCTARATPVSDVLFMGHLENRHRALVDGSGVPVPGIVALGDASTITNPFFGRGVPLALAHAAMLADVLDAVADAADAGSEFQARTEALMRPWWEDSVRHDALRQVWLRAARGDRLSSADEEILASDEARAHRGVSLVLTRDAEVFRLVVRDLGSLDHPSRIHATEVARRIVALVGDDDLLAAPLTRDELLALLGSH